MAAVHIATAWVYPCTECIKAMFLTICDHFSCELPTKKTLPCQCCYCCAWYLIPRKGRYWSQRKKWAQHHAFLLHMVFLTNTPFDHNATSLFQTPHGFRPLKNRLCSSLTMAQHLKNSNAKLTRKVFKLEIGSENFGISTKLKAHETWIPLCTECGDDLYNLSSVALLHYL